MGRQGSQDNKQRRHQHSRLAIPRQGNIPVQKPRRQQLWWNKQFSHPNFNLKFINEILEKAKLEHVGVDLKRFGLQKDKIRLTEKIIENSHEIQKMKIEN